MQCSGPSFCLQTTVNLDENSCALEHEHHKQVMVNFVTHAEQQYGQRNEGNTPIKSFI